MEERGSQRERESAEDKTRQCKNNMQEFQAWPHIKYTKIHICESLVQAANWCFVFFFVFFSCHALKKSHFANKKSCIMRIPDATARTPEFTASSKPLTTERKEFASQKKRKEKDYSTSREEPNISQLNVSLRLDFDSVQQSVNLNQVWCIECGFPHTAGIQQMRLD